LDLLTKRHLADTQKKGKKIGTGEKKPLPGGTSGRKKLPSALLQEGPEGRPDPKGRKQASSPLLAKAGPHE